MKVDEWEPLIDRLILAKVYHVRWQEPRKKKHVYRATGAFVKVLVIIFDK